MRKFKLKGGFTLLELLVVVAIISVLTAVILSALNGARNKGVDAGVKSNLRNAIGQAEIFYNTNTASPNTYTNVCLNGTVAGSKTLSAQMLAAAKASGLATYSQNVIGSTSTVTCNDSASAWAAEAPLSTSGQMWCIDSTGKSKQEPSSSLTTATTYTCI